MTGRDLLILAGLLLLVGGSSLWTLPWIMRIWRGLQRIRLQRYLERHPEDGEMLMDGTYRYRGGLLTLYYLHHPDLRPPRHVLWLRTKIRLLPMERAARTVRQRLHRVLTSSWIPHLLHWRTGGVLLCALLLAWRLIETEAARQERWAWVVARTLGLNPAQVEIQPGGWVTIEGSRTTAVDRAAEPVTFLINPWRWLTTREHGYVIRYRGEPYGMVTHAVSLTDRAEIWIHKDGQWRHGRLAGDAVTWTQPEGTGIREGQVQRQQLPAVNDQPRE